MRICVIGTGYVGLVAAACLAEMGHRVTGVDADAAKVRRLRSGACPIHEPGLGELLQRHLGRGLDFVTALDAAAPGAEIILLAVGTRQAADGAADLSELRRAAADLAPLLSEDAVVVSKSTAPVGTGAALRDLMAVRSSRRFHLAVNPEFLRQGYAVDDFLRPARIVIGADDEAARERLLDLYRPLGRPLHCTDMRSAEMIKYAANAFLAVKISFINSIADLCERVGADIEAVAAAVGADPRVGHGCLRAGLGFGGSCLPKDTASLVHQARAAGCECPVVEAARAVNRDRPQELLRRLEARLGGLRGRRIALLGLAFKGGTDDIRESRGLELARMMLQAGAQVRAYDPAAMPRAQGEVAELECRESAYQTAAGAEAVVIAADWQEFRELDLARLRAVMARPLVVDGCNLFAPEDMARAGIEYHSIGRAVAAPQPVVRGVGARHALPLHRDPREQGCRGAEGPGAVADAVLLGGA
jgi:UDPglucose 6-dehydrogenase